MKIKITPAFALVSVATAIAVWVSALNPPELPERKYSATSSAGLDSGHETQFSHREQAGQVAPHAKLRR